MPDPKPYSAPAVSRAVRVVEHLAACAAPRRLSALARELECSKGTLHGILGALEGAGWVERTPAGFRVGAGLLALGRQASGVRDVARVARPVMERLAQRLGLTAFLGGREGDRVVIRDCVEGGGEMRIAARPGATLPLFVAATGKVLLAALPPAEARGLVERHGLPRYTDRSVTDPEAFLAAVEQVGKRGYATDDEEYLRGTRAVAAAVRCGGAVAAVLWVAGLGEALPAAEMEPVGRAVAGAAAEVGALLDPA